MTQEVEAELDATTEGLLFWVKWYLAGSALLTVMLLFGALGEDGGAGRAVVAMVLFWVGLAVAIRRIQDFRSIGAAWFLAIVPWLLSVAGLFRAFESGSDLLSVIDAALFGLAFGGSGIRCLVLAYRVRKLVDLDV